MRIGARGAKWCQAMPTAVSQTESQKAMTPSSTNRIKTAGDSMPVEVSELANLVESLPAEYQEDFSACVHRLMEFTSRRRRILNLVQEALGQLRLDMKYLMFDLDATRRERDEYKRTLDEKGF